VKDLRIFKNVPLSNILLVDNAVYSFGLQLDNGIPVTSFKEDPDDHEFKHLIPYLEKCAHAADVREVNRSIFRFSEISRHNLDSFIDFYDYEECEKIMEEDEDPIHSTGSQSMDEGRLGKSVTKALDALSKIMEQNGGKLPI